MRKSITFIILFSIWLLWSGLYDAFHLALGVISSLIVVFWTGHLFVEENVSFKQRLTEWLRFEFYIIWLLWQIVLANIQVFKLSFHPKLYRHLRPQVTTFKTSLTGDVALFILAQSITLTPGTVTVKIIDDEFHVHALDNHSAAGVPGQMEQKVAAIFGGSR